MKGHNGYNWLCKCECGKRTNVNAYSLLARKAKSCGCLKFAKRGPKNDLIGLTFNKLKVISLAEQRDSSTCYYWRCKCECGNYTEVATTPLSKGVIKSCGCLKGQGNRLPGNIPIENQNFRMYKKGADDRGIKFSLSRDEFLDMAYSDCYYCGKPPNNPISYQGRKDISGFIPMNGVDRVNNDMDYSLNNCVPCCTECNRMKWRMTHDEFIDKIKSIAKNIKKNNIQLIGRNG